ncbi:hypothetical protein DL95DRAFT_453502 [Leptodontidium sp. 2 PMI_412]|nr:hypothetical protein DL95DRAFT_453502 [Leptodontidium sp. 2 PMI_412]
MKRLSISAPSFLAILATLISSTISSPLTVQVLLDTSDIPNPLGTPSNALSNSLPNSYEVEIFRSPGFTGTKTTLKLVPNARSTCFDLPIQPGSSGFEFGSIRLGSRVHSCVFYTEGDQCQGDSVWTSTWLASLSVLRTEGPNSYLPSPSINFFTEKYYDGDQATYNFGDSCTDIDEPYRNNIGSLELGGDNLYGCRFFAKDGCSGEFLLFLEEGSYSTVGEWGHRAASFQCAFGEELSFHSKHHTYQNKFSATKAKTAEVVLYKDLNLEGESEKLTVSSKECNEIQGPFLYKVRSMTIDAKIWYCLFFIESGCEGNESVELGPGTHGDLFGYGLDMASFQCVLFKRAPHRTSSLG